MNKTQSILEYLKGGNSINDRTAAHFFNSYRLSAIIYELRHRHNLDIRDRWIENPKTGARYKEYYLVEGEK